MFFIPANSSSSAFIRVGSTNRLASSEMIVELERRKQNISFDSEFVYTKTIEEINISTFKDFFREKTGEELMDLMELKNRTKFRNKYVKSLIEVELLEQATPDKPTSSNQEYFLTAKGLAFLQIRHLTC